MELINEWSWIEWATEYSLMLFCIDKCRWFQELQFDKEIESEYHCGVYFKHIF